MAAILPGKLMMAISMRGYASLIPVLPLMLESTEHTDHKILKLPAFLRGRAACNFYAIPEEERQTYNDAVKSMRRALCPQAKRENFFVEFEQ